MPSIHCLRGLDTFGCNVAVGDAKSCKVPYPYYVVILVFYGKHLVLRHTLSGATTALEEHHVVLTSLQFILYKITCSLSITVERGSYRSLWNASSPHLY